VSHVKRTAHPYEQTNEQNAVALLGQVGAKSLAALSTADRTTEARQRATERRGFALMALEATRHRDTESQKPGKAYKNPEAPPTLYELYLWFKAKGELDYFFANICRDPKALTS
jgi:hypothetical protein